MMRALARLGADLEATNDNGSRPLHIVAQEGQALVQLGAQIEAPGAEQHTPLQIAAQCGCVEVVRTLLQLGAKPDSADPSTMGLGPLHLAAANGFPRVIQLLLAAGANKEAQGVGNTGPLHAAAANGNLEAVRALLAAGADANFEDEEGRTALYGAAVRFCAETLNGGDCVRIGDRKGGVISSLIQVGRTPNRRAASWRRCVRCWRRARTRTTRSTTGGRRCTPPRGAVSPRSTLNIMVMWAV